MIHTIIQQNFISVVIILFLIMFILTNSNFDKKTNHFFLASAICVLLLIIEETWEAQLALKSTFTRTRVILSAIGYTLRPTTAYFLVMVMERDKEQTIKLTIPLLINVIVAFSALFSDWFFSYTTDNKFIRGPLGFTPFVVAGFYVFILLYKTMRESRRGGMFETMTVSAIGLLTVVATVMETFFGFRAIQCASCGISITFLYLFLHTNQNNRDPLTGALTRRKFYLDAAKYHNSLSAIVSLDLNNLKEINDKYGHLAGDEALINIASTIKKHMNKKRALYRIGGDEFMILCYKMSDVKVQELIKLLQKDIEKTPYRCAIGYALYNSKKELDATVQVADKAMYDNKIFMKKQQLQ